MSLIQRHKLLFASLCLAFSQTAIQAASITWGTATTISADTDVSTNGTRVFAYDLNIPTTVNGVSFDIFSVNLGPTDTVGSVTLSNGTSINMGFTGSFSPPFTNLSNAYQTLLKYGVLSFVDVSMTIANLSPGSQYEFEVWVNNQQTPGAVGVNDGAGHSVNLSSGSSFSLGRFVKGTFTADATTQSIGFVDNAGLHDVPVNAFQLRLLSSPVPEPSTFFLTAIAVIGLLRLRTR